jgi:hypothetical protein
MTKTMEALDKFAQALPPPPAPRAPAPPPGPYFLRDPDPAPFRPQSHAGAATSAPVSDAGETPDALLSRQAGFSWGDLLRTAAPEAPAPSAEGGDVGPAAVLGQSCALPSTARTGAIKAEAAPNGRSATAISEGTTRRGGRGDWHRLVGLVVLAATIGVGFQFLVQASARAGEAHWRQGVGKSLTSAHHHATRRRSSADPVSHG